MIPFNLILNEVIKNTKLKHFEPLEIQSNQKHCPKCNFLIFDDYWTGEIENQSVKVCTTCGEKF